MNNKIVAVGLKTDQKNNVFSGQAMMFDAIVDFLGKQDFSINVINLTSKYQNIKVGKFSVKRTLEYILIILRSFFILYRNRKGLLYITTAQTKSGFIRDYIFINTAHIFGYKILTQQFGSNFESFYLSLSQRFQKLVKNTFEKVDNVIVEGDFTKQQFSIIENYNTKVIPVINGLPEQNIKITGRGKLYNPKDSFNLIYLSYMIETKGYWDVLKAVDILVNEYKKNVRCVFAGVFKSSVDDELYTNEREAKNAFFQYVRDKNLKQYIEYFPGLMGDEKASAFLNSNAFLLPTYFKFEGQPVSVIEAMAYGSVPIVTNYRMIPNMVTNSTGIFVEKKSPKQIANKVKYLIENPHEYEAISQASVNRFLEKYTLNKYCYNILNIIKKHYDIY